MAKEIMLPGGKKKVLTDEGDFVEQEGTEGNSLNDTLNVPIAVLENMGEQMAKMQSAVEIAHNMIAAILVALNKKKITLGKEVLDAVTSEPRHSFSLSNKDGNLIITKVTRTDEEVKDLLEKASGQVSQG
jgi:hypothetical protein